MIFRKLFGKPEITADWIADPGLKISFDFDNSTLCEVSLKDPIAKLSKLGAAENKSQAKMQQYSYYRYGLEFGEEQGKIDSFILYWQDVLYQTYSPFSGKCYYKGKEILLNEKSTEQEFIDQFGAPYWRDQDQDEIILFYEFPGLEWQVEFSLERNLKVLFVVAEPLMADREQREIFKVTRPWPPNYP